MNVAFPAILLFLLLSPGIFFYSHYQPREVRAADMSPFGQTVIYVVFWSVVFDSLTMVIAVYWLGYHFSLGQLVRLLVDGRVASGDPGLAPLFARLDAHPTEPLNFLAPKKDLRRGGTEPAMQRRAMTLQHVAA